MNLEEVRSELENRLDVEFNCKVYEIIKELEKKIGIQESMLSMVKADRANLAKELEIVENKNKQLQNKLSAIKAKQLEDRERELELQIVEKTNKLNSLNKVINKIEEEITVFNDQYNIIRY